jgi:hypothetical protein
MGIVINAVRNPIEDHSHGFITTAAFVDLPPNSILSVYFPAIF